ncbi:hypothetical protein MFLAVUS_011474 [Mucor flavus]|uniref:Uncharacterized protein n=1 Tax=Mucor flavus TaxID=439312 RepID=A0ABP9ZFK1_9FUNG
MENFGDLTEQEYFLKNIKRYNEINENTKNINNETLENNLINDINNCDNIDNEPINTISDISIDSSKITGSVATNLNNNNEDVSFNDLLNPNTNNSKNMTKTLLELMKYINNNNPKMAIKKLYPFEMDNIGLRNDIIILRLSREKELIKMIIFHDYKFHSNKIISLTKTFLDEYEVASLELAPYAGDRSKLLSEAKIIYNSIIRIGIGESDAYALNVVNMQIMGNVKQL